MVAGVQTERYSSSLLRPQHWPMSIFGNCIWIRAWAISRDGSIHLKDKRFLVSSLIPVLIAGAAR